MTEPTLTPEALALRAAYAALNRGDVAGFMAVFAADVERVEPPGFPPAETYRGLAAFADHAAAARGTWAGGACEPERFLVAGDRLIAFVHVRVRLRSETTWRDGRVVDVFRFRDGKAVEFRTFLDERQAFAFAGVDEAS